jgi:hypothetical protein
MRAWLALPRKSRSPGLILNRIELKFGATPPHPTAAADNSCHDLPRFRSCCVPTQPCPRTCEERQSSMTAHRSLGGQEMSVMDPALSS